MKKRHSIRKLNLTKETVARLTATRLTDQELREVVGGASLVSVCNATDTKPLCE